MRSRCVLAGSQDDPEQGASRALRQRVDDSTRGPKRLTIRSVSLTSVIVCGMGLGDLTAVALNAAMDEYDDLGRSSFPR